jgi:cytochrome c oxidase assembly protein subunit 15
VTAAPRDRPAQRLCALLAGTAVALTFVVVVASAYLRHVQAGLGCAPWPDCYGAVAAAAVAGAQPEGLVRIARIAHRLCATAVAAALIGLTLVAWSQRPVWLREALAATAALVVAGSLAVLGIVAGGSKAPTVVLGNLLGGYLLLALVAAARALASTAPPPSGARAAALAALAVAFVAAAFGGAISAHSASRACAALVDCATTLDALARAPIEMLRAPDVAGVATPPAWAGALHTLHRIAALALVVPASVVAYRLRAKRPRLAAALASIVALAVATGAVAAAERPWLGLAMLHDASAALIVALLCVAGVRAPPAPAASSRGASAP